MSKDLEQAQESNNRMEAVLESKLLNFNLDKSVFLVIGKKNFKKAIEKKLEECPLTLCNEKMKQVDAYSYLGDVISDKGVAHSALATINKRYGSAYKAIFEIKVIIEDARSEVPGSFITAMKLWEMAVMPSLLNSAECWFQISGEAIKKLKKAVTAVLFCCPAGRPWVSYTGSLLVHRLTAAGQSDHSEEVIIPVSRYSARQHRSRFGGAVGHETV